MDKGILIHSNNEYLLLNEKIVINLSKNHIFGGILKTIYPVQIYDGCSFNIFIDTLHKLHIIKYQDDKITMYNNVHIPKIKNGRILSAHIDNKVFNSKCFNITICIGKYYKNTQMYICEKVIITINSLKYDILERSIVKTYNVNKCIVSPEGFICMYTNNNTILIRDGCRDMDDMEIYDDNKTIIDVGSEIIYVSNNKLHSAIPNNGYYPAYIEPHETIFDFTQTKVKCFYYDYFLKALCYVNIDDEIIVEETYTHKTKKLGVIKDPYKLYYYHNVLYFIKPHNITAVSFSRMSNLPNNIDVNDVDIIQLKQEFNISQVSSLLINNFIWTPDTHIFVPHKYKCIIEMFLLCNKQMSIYKIPYWVLYKIFSLFTKKL